MQELARRGFKHIISFCTNYDSKRGYLGMPEEAKWANKAGIKFHWLPFNAHTNPDEKDVKKFFKITDNARLNNERVFIHCRYGADRTGTYSAIYKIRNYNASLESVIKEMLKYGHDANSHQNLIPFVVRFKKDNSFNMKGQFVRFISAVKKYMGKIK